MKVALPIGKYIKGIEVNDDHVSIRFAKKKKIALLFISLNDIYWPYLTQVLNDCRKNFLPQHNVDYFVWTDYNEEAKKRKLVEIETTYQRFLQDKKQEDINSLFAVFAATMRLNEVFYPTQVVGVANELKALGIDFKRNGGQFWMEANRPVNDQDIAVLYESLKRLILLGYTDMDAALKGVTISDTAPIEWPAPTLMRYHLFLNQEEKLKEYDYIFYLDADMRVVSKVSDEILGEGLTVAPHPGYVLAPQYIPPYEPNPSSTAYIHRFGRLVDEQGKKRFLPFYAAGGFQGGITAEFLKAMRVMKKRIDKDFDNNYTAIWNDESHWNKYLWEYKKLVTFLDPSYVYPDSLIKEFYEKLWGRSYEPKIITLTKPFSLSSEGAEAINKLIQ